MGVVTDTVTVTDITDILTVTDITSAKDQLMPMPKPHPKPMPPHITELITVDYGYPYGRYYGYGYPYYYHPVAASVSHQHVSTPAATYGVHQIHKREAEAEADPAVLYGLHYPGVAGHPGAATSFVARSPQGARGYYAHPYGAFFGR